ncbi:dynactin subunit 3-like [Belonocnema kinseyi]|uniref:dynactin subunit 3-like n=1 Tax=Belonocnema kinseyi TaxID=2817044 RepID=UPI00143DCAF9|nr:dynactin subunit 3-like [Belonocnema kinseyi]XP_033220474.1 dynactin subunit 3-like [Belonocnema kinseyi]XP_033220483.1 dynactin subunit 3-like [Belonocnema kinseyi]
MVDGIQILEERVTSLEKQIYGTGRTSAASSASPETPVIENLINANVFVSSALSGRENANALINRLPELSSYLDPHFEDSELQTDAKLEFLLATELEIRENLRLLNEMEKLIPVLETDRIRDVPELSKKLSSITLNYLNMNEQSKTLTGEIHQLFSKYNSIITSISELLITMDARITAAEIAAMPKKQID